MACYKMRPQFLQPINYLEVFKAAFKMSETTASEAQRRGLGLPYGKVVKNPCQKCMLFLNSRNPAFICVKCVLVAMGHAKLVRGC